MTEILSTERELQESEKNADSLAPLAAGKYLPNMNVLRENRYCYPCDHRWETSRRFGKWN